MSRGFFVAAITPATGHIEKRDTPIRRQLAENSG
jgi:hypothetical protein